ncbi:cell wall hydrolase [Metabacillus idriensis]|uniref:cell wall hydrolase n=1 Tax=Metabacillus idriensis TaxID=324768 RepID=UPI0028141017|nr:cell wall hydrolase [Metabacillus idriensis]MDR0137003.1 cell wall hydrolase [Metabacillus idriensis]
MKKAFFTFTIISALTLSLFGFEKAEAAAKHEVKTGDTLWLIGKKYGVSIKEIQSLNHKSGQLLYVGEKLEVPQSISDEDKDLLARIVHAEAKGEPYAGKVAVATVVLNRVKDDRFPDTIKDVIYQKQSGIYAFSPVENGSINEPADDEAKEAVQEALAYEGMGNDSVYFYNPVTAESDWIRTREVTLTIGKHTFAK